MATAKRWLLVFLISFSRGQAMAHSAMENEREKARLYMIQAQMAAAQTTSNLHNLTRLRTLIRHAILMRGCSTAKPLVDRLVDPDSRIREGGLSDLRALNGPGADCLAAELVSYFKDARAPGRANAVWAMGELGPQAASLSGDVSEALREDADSGVRANAAAALARIGVPAAFVASNLAQAARDPFESALVRLTATASLATLGPVAAATAIAGQIADEKEAFSMAQALSDMSPEIVVAARNRLAKLGRPALPILANCLYRGNDQLRRSAALALSDSSAHREAAAILNAFQNTQKIN